MKELSFEEYYGLLSEIQSYKAVLIVLGIILGALVGGLLVFILGKLCYGYDKNS